MSVREPHPADFADWRELAEAYQTFYERQLDDSEYEQAWRGLLGGGPAHGLVIEHGGRVQGLAHYLFHASTWSGPVCYLQDLFVHPDARGQGLGERLIAAVAERARTGGATRFYWLTQAHNATARRLYDRVAEHRGFIRYDHSIS